MATRPGGPVQSQSSPPHGKARIKAPVSPEDEPRLRRSVRVRRPDAGDKESAGPRCSCKEGKAPDQGWTRRSRKRAGMLKWKHGLNLSPPAPSPCRGAKRMRRREGEGSEVKNLPLRRRVLWKQSFLLSVRHFSHGQTNLFALFPSGIWAHVFLLPLGSLW